MTRTKIYFASDFHLGVPNGEKSKQRELLLVRWLDKIRQDAKAVYLVGDIFDFWFEYKHAVPKGYVRFLAKLAELVDDGIEVHLFTGNHDMWMFDYLPKELGVNIHRNPIEIKNFDQTMLVGHGDGLGPGDRTYKFLKLFFNSKICMWLFARIHPNLGMGIAQLWSKKSRLANIDKGEEFESWEKEFLYKYIQTHPDHNRINVFLFGHRHLVFDTQVEGTKARYINLGEWVTGNPHFALWDENGITLHKVKEFLI